MYGCFLASIHTICLSSLFCCCTWISWRFWERANLSACLGMLLAMLPLCDSSPGMKHGCHFLFLVSSSRSQVNIPHTLPHPPPESDPCVLLSLCLQSLDCSLSWNRICTHLVYSFLKSYNIFEHSGMIHALWLNEHVHNWMSVFLDKFIWF